MRTSGLTKGEEKSEKCSVLEPKRRKYFEKAVVVNHAKPSRQALESKG